MQEGKPQPDGGLHVDRMHWRVVHRGPDLSPWEQRLAGQEAAKRLQRLSQKQV